MIGHMENKWLSENKEQHKQQQQHTFIQVSRNFSVIARTTKIELIFYCFDACANVRTYPCV